MSPSAGELFAFAGLWELWNGPGGETPLRPCPPEAIAIRRVGRAVNNARNDAPGLIEPEDA